MSADTATWKRWRKWAGGNWVVCSTHSRQEVQRMIGENEDKHGFYLCDRYGIPDPDAFTNIGQGQGQQHY